MAQHNYSAIQALSFLLRVVEERSPELASSLRAAIDTGKDILEYGDSEGTRKPREYRKAVRFNEEEALRVVIKALRAHFVEHPLLINSAISEFANATIDERDSPNRQSKFGEWPSRYTGSERVQKRLEIELQTETRMLMEDEETVPLSPIDSEMIARQNANIEVLSELTNFE